MCASVTLVRAVITPPKLARLVTEQAWWWWQANPHPFLCMCVGSCLLLFPVFVFHRFPFPIDPSPRCAKTQTHHTRSRAQKKNKKKTPMRNDRSTRRPLPFVNKKKPAHGRGHRDACQSIHTHARLVVNWQTPQPRSRHGPYSQGRGRGVQCIAYTTTWLSGRPTTTRCHSHNHIKFGISDRQRSEN